MPEINFRADEMYPTYFVSLEKGISTFTVTLTEEELADFTRAQEAYRVWQDRLYDLDPDNVQ